MTHQADVHLCLISANITPNLTPLLNSEIRPQHVVLMYAADELPWLEGFMRLVATLDGMTVSCRLLSDASGGEAVRADVLSVLAKHEGQTVALNASGGSRLVSLVAAQVFQGLNKPVFYVDAYTDQLVSVHPHDVQVYSLQQRVEVQQYLAASGYDVEEKEVATLTSAQRAFAQELLANIRHYSGSLAILNWLAASAGSGLQSKPIESWHMSSPAFIGLLDRLRDVGLALVNRNCLVFPGEPEKFFVNGGWLQDYVALIMAELKGRSAAVQSFEQALRVSKEGGQRSDIDSVFMVNNRVHLIECHAKKFKKGNVKNGAEAVHRLDELKNLGEDLQAETVLLSYCPLRDLDVRRMQLMGIKVLQEKQLQNLRFYLEDWIAGK